MTKELQFRFSHGLGDSVHLIHLLQLYQSNGYRSTVDCEASKAVLFEAFGIKVEHNTSFPGLAWGHAPHAPIDDENYWLRNKPFFNLGKSPLPDLEPPSHALFSRFADVTLKVQPFLTRQQMKAINESRSYLDKLLRPLILLHTRGNSFQDSKSIPDEQCLPLYRTLLDTLGGTILLLDWDNRVPMASSYRLRHLTSDWKWLDLPTLMATIEAADLLIGIDSGPLHLCRFFDIPAIGLWLNDHHPHEYALPRKQQVNIVLKRNGEPYNKYTRVPYNIVECQEDEIPPSLIARLAKQMLSPSVYLKAGSATSGSDVQLQHLIHDFTRDDFAPGGNVFNDRNVGFDMLAKQICKLDNPAIVETGCIRQEEDFRGAGFGTYLLGLIVYRLGKGKLDSVDNSQENVAFARKWTRIFDQFVQVHLGDSINFLRERVAPIDILYLDSLDADHPDAAAHGLAEFKAAERYLTPDAMVVCDDTYWAGGQWHGKGGLAVPYLLERNWQIAHSGWQTILKRTNE